MKIKQNADLDQKLNVISATCFEQSSNFDSKELESNRGMTIKANNYCDFWSSAYDILN